MKPTSFTYERTVNLGNYESAKFAITVELKEGDKLGEAHKNSIGTIDKFIDHEVKRNAAVRRGEKGQRI